MNLSPQTIDPLPITVEDMVQSPMLRLPLECVNPSVPLTRKITDKNIHRPQLALAGYVGLFTYHRVQIFGNTEIFYLESLTPKKRQQAFRTIAQFEIPCIILTNSHTLDDEIVNLATEYQIPLLRTPLETTRVTYILSEFLDTHFAPQVSLHGSFVDVYGVGIMFVGKSGIGKSEIALDLIERGHRLVADDVVILTQKRDDILIGTGTQLVQHFMEVRGLGLIDIRQMFGIRAVRYQKRLEIVVELEHWDETKAYTRTGLDAETVRILDVPISYVRLPILPGKNITVIAEVIALNYLLRAYGYDPAQAFSQRLEDEILRNAKVRNTSVRFRRNLSQYHNDFE
ncbi:MAG: HPr(Ser) kinase/phosphatase [Bacteroidota bacterium]|nr:HPr(Ser) kinase/phosphatase [Candidatus Kapabacteria bacterium]MDW8220282.1 HPr(Ser) kinase/phosphatase [Bacteroidota bacterium]